MLHLIDDAVARCADIEALLARKRSSPELGRGEPLPRIQAFIEQELQRLQAISLPAPPAATTVEVLNTVFHRVPREALP